MWGFMTALFTYLVCHKKTYFHIYFTLHKPWLCKEAFLAPKILVLQSVTVTSHRVKSRKYKQFTLNRRTTDKTSEWWTLCFDNYGLEKRLKACFAGPLSTSSSSLFDIALKVEFLNEIDFAITDAHSLVMALWFIAKSLPNYKCTD